ncbi:MAG: phage Gp37/Gp68 family protein [Synergistaceae bacterium]|jgi:protein gp37|nr:phage Gp37/Gp68 family protein [Synergistaceae bacterium]
MQLWNFQTGCTKVSVGCLNCYAEASYIRYGHDFRVVHKTKQFNAVLDKNKYPPGEDVWVCNTSDFFHAGGDSWRSEVWDTIKARLDLRFMIVTKRVERIVQSLPPDWGDGYDNVWLCCTAEDQANSDERLPVFSDIPIKHKMIMVEPLLGQVDISKYLATGQYVQVVSGGECCQSKNCRLTLFDDVMFLLDQCRKYGVTFTFERTGTRWCGAGMGEKYQYIRGQGEQVNLAETLDLNYWSGNPDCFRLPIKYSGCQRKAKPKPSHKQQTLFDMSLR